MNDPRVTVIIPTHNRAALLEIAIASALAQSYQRLTLLVTDNASTDDTRRVIERISDPRLVFVRHPEDIGWIGNFNQALETVETEYVMILNDDDYLLPGAIERAVAVLDAHPRVGMVHSAFDLVDHDGAMIRAHTDWTHGLEGDTLQPGSEYIRRALLHFGVVCPPSVVRRVGAIPGVRFDPVDAPMADFALDLRTALHWDVQFLGTPGVAFREHAEQSSGKWGATAPNRVYFHRIDAIERMRDVKLRFLRDHADDIERPRTLRRLVRQFVRNELVARVKAKRAEGRGAGVRELVRGVRAAPSLAVSRLGWRCAVSTMVGPKIRRRVRRSPNTSEGQ